MSIRYTNQSIRFYKVDATALEKLAKKYNISTEPTGKQLPTLLMLENGKETGRFPPVPKPGMTGPVGYNERRIVRYLELENKFYMTSAKQ